MFQEKKPNVSRVTTQTKTKLYAEGYIPPTTSYKYLIKVTLIKPHHKIICFKVSDQVRLKVAAGLKFHTFILSRQVQADLGLHCLHILIIRLFHD